MSAAYVRCEVLPGQFDSEYYILVNHSSAYYIHRHNVRGVREEPRPDRAVQGEVLAYIVERSEGRVLVQLPGEAVVGGVRTWVENDNVSAA